MAQKRRQTEQGQQQQLQKQEETEPEAKRMKSNRPTNQRTQQNHLMAQAALARINKASQIQNQDKTQQFSQKPATKNEQIDSEDPNLNQDYQLEIGKLNKTISSYKSIIESQSDLIDSIKSSLSCNICFEIIDSPYALLCGHIFCHKDLYAWFHRSSTSLSDQQDHHYHHHHTNNARFSSRNLDYHSSDSERIASALNETTNSAAGARTTVDRNTTEQSELASQLNPGTQEGQRVVSLDARMNDINDNSQATQQPRRAPPISPRRRRQNLICPQCRAQVIGRPISLYVIKDITTKLRSSEPPTCTSSTSAPVPMPSSSNSNSNSIRNMVELHRDEKDLTWGNLFPVNLPTSNSTGATQDLAQRLIIDTQDGVNRCGRCAWEIGTDGVCVGCGAEYLDLLEDSSSSSDSSFHAHSEDDEYMSTDFSEGGIEGEDGDGDSSDSGRIPWGAMRGRYAGPTGLSWMEDEEGSQEENGLSATEMEESNARSSSNLSNSSDGIRVTARGSNARRNLIQVSSDSEEEDGRFGAPSNGHRSSTPGSSSSFSVRSRIPPAYISSDESRPEDENSRRSTSHDDDDGHSHGPHWVRSSSYNDDRSEHDGSYSVREVFHYRSGSERSFDAPQSSDDGTQWSGIRRFASDNGSDHHVDYRMDDRNDANESEYQGHDFSSHQDHWGSQVSSSDDDDDY